MNTLLTSPMGLCVKFSVVRVSLNSSDLARETASCQDPRRRDRQEQIRGHTTTHEDSVGSTLSYHSRCLQVLCTWCSTSSTSRHLRYDVPGTMYHIQQ